MIPNRLPMPGGGARVAQSVPQPPKPTTPPPTEPDDLVGDVPPTFVEPGNSKAVLDPNAKFEGPPRPKTAGRGGSVQFSSQRVDEMIRLLESALNPKVTFSEDMNAMRILAEKQRVSGLTSVLAALRTPA